MPIITIPEILEEKLTHDGAEALVMLFNSFEIRAKDDILKASDDKFGRRLTEAISGLRSEFKEDNAGLKTELKEDIAGLKTELKEDIAGLKTELKEDIASLKTELKEDIANIKVEIIKSEARLETKMANLETKMANLETKMAQSKTDLIKWFVGAAIAQIAIILSVLSMLK